MTFLALMPAMLENGGNMLRISTSSSIKTEKKNIKMGKKKLIMKIGHGISILQQCSKSHKKLLLLLLLLLQVKLVSSSVMRN